MAAFAPSAAMAATQGYIVTSFEAVRLDAPISVSITTGRGATARGEGDRDVLDRVELVVSGRLLTIRLRPGTSGGKSVGGTATLILSTGMVTRLTVNGGGKLSVDRLKGQQAILSMSGNGEMSVQDMAVDRLRVLVAGNGRMTLSGKAAAIDARVLGPGTVAASALTGRDVTVANDGPGAITLTAITSASLSASGTGETVVLGTPACTVKRGGAGKVECASKSY